jgi:hypothetical protein
MHIDEKERIKTFALLQEEQILGLKVYSFPGQLLLMKMDSDGISALQIPNTAQ